MNFESTDIDILHQYMTVSNKLKKRFMKKPNDAEACEQFTNLAKQCETLELPQYAGLCWIAAARCEGTLINNTAETSCLCQSARQLFKAEEKDISMGCKNVPGEYFQAGLSCYAHAASRYPENCTIPLCLNLEIVDFLKRIDRPQYIQDYLEDSIKLSKDRTNTKLHCLDLLASIFVKSGDFVAAFDTFLEIKNIAQNLPPSGAMAEILLKCEINTIFLLLILRPSPRKLSPNLAKIVEKYTWGDKSDASLKACRMKEDLFLLLQSLVAICQSLDTSSLVDLESDFWKILAKEEKELLRTLVKTYQM